jgi:hypothetical protein
VRGRVYGVHMEGGLSSAVRQVSALDFFVTLSRELQQMGLRPGERELFMETLQNARKAGVPPKQQLDTFLLEWAASSAEDSVVVGKPFVPPSPQRGAAGGDGDCEGAVPRAETVCARPGAVKRP